jgi:hypothetical protein
MERRMKVSANPCWLRRTMRNGTGAACCAAALKDMLRLAQSGRRDAHAT